MSKQVTMQRTRSQITEEVFTFEGLSLNTNEETALCDYVLKETKFEVNCIRRREEFVVSAIINTNESLTLIEEWTKEVEEAIKAYLKEIRTELEIG